MSHSIERLQAMDLMPQIIFDKAELFIKSVTDEAISWTILVQPLLLETWLAMLAMALIISCLLTCIEWLFQQQQQNGIPSSPGLLLGYFGNLWLALTANFGGKPNKLFEQTSHKLVMFLCLLLGSLIWMFYRSSLTSELSIIKTKLPFTDLYSLHSRSDYRFIVPENDSILAQVVFMNAKPDSIYGKPK